MARSKRTSRWLLRSVCYLLRHQSESNILPRDQYGFVAIARLHRALAQSVGDGRAATLDDVRLLLARQPDRFEVDGERVRARYGHSLDSTEPGPPATPPSRLYHGTCHRWLAAIQGLGLRPMGRRFVHLTSDLDYARSIALKAPVAPLIVQVEAGQAHTQGVRFWNANRHVWLAEFIPPAFLNFETEPAVDRYWREVEDRLGELGRGVTSTTPASLEPSWYHVCPTCTAKWFAPRQQCVCPRCDRQRCSTEQRLPSWAGRSWDVRVPPST